MPLFYSVFKESRQVRCAAQCVLAKTSQLSGQCSQGWAYLTKLKLCLAVALSYQKIKSKMRPVKISHNPQHSEKRNPNNKMTILFREVINKCLLVVTLTLVFNAKTCLCDVIVTNKNYTSTLARFHSASASFGESLPSEGLKGVAIKSVPEDGCHEIDPPPSTPQNM